VLGEAKLVDNKRGVVKGILPNAVKLIFARCITGLNYLSLLGMGSP